MKKVLYLMLISLLFIPISTKALVNDTIPDVGGYYDKASCEAELSANEGLSNATNGWYLTCIELTCVNSKIVHTDLARITQNLTCANGNKNFQWAVKQFGSTDGENAVGQACVATPDVPYSTQKIQYNCAKNADGSNYNPGGGGNNGGGGNGGTVNSPDTGLNSYYTVLGSSVVILSLGLYIVSKRNLFKKI